MIPPQDKSLNPLHLTLIVIIVMIFGVLPARVLWNVMDIAIGPITIKIEYSRD